MRHQVHSFLENRGAFYVILVLEDIGYVTMPHQVCDHAFLIKLMGCF